MFRITITFIILFISVMQVQAYQNPYQNMWLDGILNKDCRFNVQLQMCESESENYKSLADYNKDRATGHYTCIGGKLYKRMGFNQQPILLTHTTGLPIGCTRQETGEEDVDYRTPTRKENNLQRQNMNELYYQKNKQLKHPKNKQVKYQKNRKNIVFN